jgi:hypothetical protein
MSDHADVVHGYLNRFVSLAQDRREAFDALDALVAENQQLTADRDSWRNIAQQLKHTEAVELREAKAENQRNAEKVAAYDAARATVKIDGRTRAFYVLRAEAAEAESQRLRDALVEIAELDEHGVSFIARDALAVTPNEDAG